MMYMAKPDPQSINAVMDGWLVSSVHEYPLTVQFEDTDAGGIVYHASYINFAERARTALLRVCGVFMQDLIDRDETIIVRRVEIDYKEPSLIGERLIVTSDELTLGKASFAIRQSIADENGNIRAALQVQGAFVAVSTGRPIRVPADVRVKLKIVTAKTASL
jgi:acyl-CoA thioester hydrolase